MANDPLDYFAIRALEEDRLAESSINPLVKATHKEFAAAYRAQAGPRQPLPAIGHSTEAIDSS